MKKYILIVLIPTAFILFLIHWIVPEPNETDIDDYIAKAFATANYKIARKACWRRIKTDFSNIEYHRDYIYASHKSGYKRNPPLYYNSYLQSPDSETVDLATYALGYIKMQEEDEAGALRLYLKVKNNKLTYLNNSIGYCYLALKDYEKAKYYLRREIKLKGYVEGALENYAKVLIQEKNILEINRLLAHPELGKQLNLKNKRQFYYLTGNFFSYCTTILRSHRQYIILEGIIGALLITVIWFTFFQRLAVVKPVKTKYLLQVLILSVVISQFTYLLHDFAEMTLQLRFEGSPAEKFFYCVAVIGLMEETIKTIPFLLIFFFTKERVEPVELIIYAAVAALGFAFVENLAYFDNSGLSRITGRAMTATMMHIILSAIAVYGLVLYRFKKSFRIWILVFFLSACFLHGSYDFCLLVTRQMNGPFFIVWVCLFILSQIIFSGIIRKTLANSKSFHTGNAAERLRKNGQLLLHNLSYVLLIQYIIISVKYGVVFADNHLDSGMITTYVCIFVLSICLTRYKIKQGDWECCH